MLLPDLFSPAAWAILPSALEPFLQTILQTAAPPAPPLPQAATSSTAGDDPPAGYSLREGIAVIDVQGIIHRRGGGVKFFGMTFSWAGQDDIRAAIDAAMRDPAAKAVLLSFESPGGVAAGVKELADFIAAQTAKPIYAYADGSCFSAAYWLASATGRLYAPLTATVGSIGVIAAHVDRSAANAAAGIRVTYIASGTWKATGNPDTPLSATDQAYLQEMMATLHEVFRGDVAAKMPVDAADPKAWGDGQCFLAEKALQLGLVNGIVTDRAALIARIQQETHMDKTELAEKHPELLAQIQAEARAETEIAMKAAHETALAAALSNTAALVKIVAGEAAAAQVAKLAAAGLTAAQIETLAPLLREQKTEGGGQKTEAGSREDILAKLRSATPAPVNTSALPKNQDAIQAAINQISAV